MPAFPACRAWTSPATSSQVRGLITRSPSWRGGSSHRDCPPPASSSHLCTELCYLQRAGANLQTLCLPGPGSLPVSWAAPGAFPTLEALNISANNLSGSLPPEWGANGTGLFRLQRLDLQQNGLEGYLPDLWGPGFQVSITPSIESHQHLFLLALQPRHPCTAWVPLVLLVAL